MEHRQGNTSCAKESQTRKRDETKLPQLLSRGESTHEKNGVTAQLLVRLIINSIRADARPTHTHNNHPTRQGHNIVCKPWFPSTSPTHQVCQHMVHEGTRQHEGLPTPQHITLRQRHVVREYDNDGGLPIPQHIKCGNTSSSCSSGKR